MRPPTSTKLWAVLFLAICWISRPPAPANAQSPLSDESGLVEPGRSHPLFRPQTPSSDPHRAESPHADRPAAVRNEPPALKLEIEASGLYRVTHGDLLAIGLDPAAIDPATFQLTHRGEAVSISVSGASDGRLDPHDEIHFYASAIHRDAPEAVYTRRNVYRLTWGQERGLRMALRNPGPGDGLPALGAVGATLHAEEENAYWQAMPPDAENDRWFWGGRLSPATQGLESRRTYTVTLGTPARQGNGAELRVAFKGFSMDDHRTRLLLNGVPLDDQEWTGQMRFVQTVRFSPELLRAGANHLTVEALPSGAPVDQFLLDWIEIDYPAQLLARAERLAFATPPGERRVEIAGFRAEAPLLFDITDATAPVQIVTQPFVAADGVYGLRFRAAGEARYLALTPSAFRRPAAIVADTPSTWRTPGHGADYIVIAHRDFLNGAERLAAHRRAQGMRVAVVAVDDLYDEFNHGIFHPAALRDFLAYAYRYWQPPAPRYVLLIGDAYQDYRNLLNPPETGLRNWAPSQIVLTELLGETSSDTWLANIDPTDPVPELAIGRLPVTNGDALGALIDRIIAYETGPENAASRALLAADDDDNGFMLATRRIAAQLPADINARFIDAAVYPPGDPRRDLLGTIAEGIVALHYSGHGDVDRWGHWRHGIILEYVDVTGMPSPALPYVVTMANCLSNFFVGPAPSMGEAFILHGGALGVWGATGLGAMPAQTRMMEVFYAALLTDTRQTLGDATLAAFAALPADDPTTHELIATFVLLGDPAMRLHGETPAHRQLLPLVYGPP